MVAFATTRESGHQTSSATAAIGHAGVDALLVALLVAFVAFAGAETHGRLLLCGLYAWMWVSLVVGLRVQAVLFIDRLVDRYRSSCGLLTIDVSCTLWLCDRVG